jgi:ubiquinone biosynthesis protein UbiJ
VVNPTLHSAVLAGLERAINAALALSPHSRDEVAALAGTAVAIDCTAPAFSVYLLPREDGALQLQGFFEGPVQTRVRGTGGDFAELAAADDPTATLVNGALALEGNSAPLLALQRVIAGLDVDWEAPLVRTLGDVPGHQLATLLRDLFHWGRDAGASLTRQLDEFLHEEAGLTPPRAELEDFYSDVQALTQAVDRLASRMERIRARLARLAGS